MLKQLTPDNARQLREQIAHMSQDSAEFREFHYAWGAIAGDEAILHGKDTPKRDMAASLAGWASEDPQSAMAYFDNLSEAKDVTLGMIVVVVFNCKMFISIKILYSQSSDWMLLNPGKIDQCLQSSLKWKTKLTFMNLWTRRGVCTRQRTT